ncbi:phosphonate C-P lyase system protein PhnG [Ferrovibrio sp.]|uniref:phosphonate C-P lyase system protein PhnG n=1 Tax=Ferrovibrio sp. TaxID=1917215 RepID=UPI003D0E1C6A
MSTASQKTNPSPSDPAIAARQRRLRLLARAERGCLEQAFAALPQQPGYRRLKQPETGLAMLRARAGGVGQRFNMGEMTISRCVVALEAGGAMGVGYVPGRDQRKAELVALFDALSQDAATAALLEASLFAPLESELAQAQAARAAKVAATKVDFFTMVRGED